MFKTIKVSKEEYSKVKEFEEGKASWAFINMQNKEALMIVNVSSNGQICLGNKEYSSRDVLNCLHSQLESCNIEKIKVVGNNKVKYCCHGNIEMLNAFMEDIKKVRAINDGENYEVTILGF